MPNVNLSGLTHDQLQSKCFEWACNAYNPYIYRRLIAIPNDAAGGNVVRGKRYQALGVTPGVWDMCFFWFRKIPNVVNHAGGEMIIPAIYWWEFKVGTDKLKQNQLNFRNAMKPLGHIFFVAQEEKEFQKQFKSIIDSTIDYAKQILNGEILNNGGSYAI